MLLAVVRHCGLLIAVCLVSLRSFTAIGQISSDARTAFISYEDAQPTLTLLDRLRPSELKSLPDDQIKAFWPTWTARQDEEIRGRVRGGDDDSFVNLLLYGTSFTTQPRVTSTRLKNALNAENSQASQIDEVIAARLTDFVTAAANPRGNERLEYVATRLEERGFRLASAEGRAQARAYMLRELSRVLREIADYERTAAGARALGDSSAEFARRSKIYEDRGLSTDTSLAPNFAIEQALRAMQAAAVAPSRIRRVAVIGPGLDFTDKQEGYDFYPPQALQPFAVIDTLVRLKLAPAGGVEVAAIDLNPRVNAHLMRIRAEALAKHGYVLQLPLDAAERWSASFLAYWSSFGSQIGKATTPAERPPNAGEVKTRAVAIEPRWVSRISQVDLNVILQRLTLAELNKFDLVVATNVFVYYDEFQQSLAMENIGAMTTPGGVLLSNNAVVELPGGPFRSVGSTTVSYSNRPENGDVIIWYRR